MPKGIIMLCSTMTVSCTLPMISPATTFVPTFTVASNFHFLFLSMAGISIPLVIFVPTAFIISTSGLCIPSKILLISPGPNSTLRGAPVDTTGSPGPKPAVSSYTCIDALSPCISIISPISL